MSNISFGIREQVFFGCFYNQSIQCKNHNLAVQQNRDFLNSSYTPRPLYSSIRSNNHNAAQTIPKSCQFQSRTTTQQPQNNCCQPPSTTTAPLPVTLSHTQHKPHHISHTTALSFNKTNLPKKINL